MGAWKPTSIRRLIKTLESSTKPVLVDTDSGQGVLKVINNPQGEQALARDWIGTHLAHTFGLPTFDIAVIFVTTDDDLILADGRKAAMGPALISRYEKGVTLGRGKGVKGIPYALRHIDNPGAVARLVIFDTWLLNRDRHGPPLADRRRRVNRENVWLSREDATQNGFVLKAIDHSECFSLGGDLTPKINSVEFTQFRGVLGLFPEFRRFLEEEGEFRKRFESATTAAAELALVEKEQIEKIVESVPSAWSVDSATRRALVQFLMERARFVSDNVMSWLWPQKQLPFT